MRKTLWVLVLMAVLMLCCGTVWAEEVFPADTTETVSFDVAVTWSDQDDRDGIRPDSIVVTISADIVSFSKTVTLDAASGWSATLTDMPRYNTNGQEIAYRILDGYCFNYNSNQSFSYETGLLLQYVYSPVTRNLRISTIWDDRNNADGLRPKDKEADNAVTITLYADGEPIRTFTPTAQSAQWAFSFTQLPKYRDAGVEIEYTISASQLSGYTTTYSNVTDDLGSLTGIVVTFFHSFEKRDISVSIEWIDWDNKNSTRPESVTLNLVKKVGNGTVIVNSVDPVVMNADNNWSYTFHDIQKNENAVEIEYSVRQVYKQGYTWSAHGDMVKGIVITNTLEEMICGEAAYWIMDDDGLLRIWGTGAINNNPWDCSIVRKIIIESGITSIDDGVFSSCENATFISIPDSVTSIGHNTFCYCTSLTSIDIPNSVTSLGEGLFEGCYGLTSINLPDNLTKIENYTFHSCTNLASVSIPDSVTSIGHDAFYYCRSLVYVSIPNSVTSIGESAFRECEKLSSIHIPNSVTSIGNYAFSGCSSLTTVILSDSLTSISDHSFWSCINLKTIQISNSVTRIGDYAFDSCDSLVSISIPNSVSEIGAHAFSWCDQLTSVTIPDGVTSIGEQAFYLDHALKKIIMPRSVTTFGANIVNSVPTVYLYAGSPAEDWAWNEYLDIVYLDDEQADDIRSLTIDEDFRMACGSEKALSYNVFPNNDNPSVTWHSSNPTVVSVENGTVRALSTGTADVTVSCGDASATVTIQVYQQVEDFELSPTEAWVIARYTCNITPINIKPSNADPLFGWSTSDINYATFNNSEEIFGTWEPIGYAYISNTGSVRTIKPGDVTITATSETGVQRTALIHICFPVTAIDLTAPKTVLSEGETMQLTANVTMRTQSCVNHLVHFTSDNEAVATVNPATGLLTAKDSGTATITVTADSGVSASITVTVGEVGSRILTLPSSLTTIESAAFTGLPSVDAIRIPAGVTSISPDAFDPGMTLILPSGSSWTQWAVENGYQPITE